MSAVFGRVLTAMVTPFTEDLKVDYERAAELAVRLADNGSEGIVVSGSTGESPTLTRSEKIRLFKVIADAVGDRIKVLAGTGSYCTEDSIELTREAEKTGVHGVLVVVPYYNKPPQEGIYKHFKMISQATGLPLMMYNIPGRTVVNMLPDTVARLSEIKNIVAIKESTGNMDQVSEIIRLTGPDFQLYSGDDHMTLPILSVGGVGVVSVASHLAGKRIGQMIEEFLAGRVIEASRIHIELMPLFKGLFFTSNPIPIKLALRLMGFAVGGLRPPLPDASPEDEVKMSKILKTAGLL